MIILVDNHYRKITDFESGEADGIPYTDAMMIDLSGGGVKLKINEKVNIHDILSIKMKIKNNKRKYLPLPLFHLYTILLNLISHFLSFYQIY